MKALAKLKDDARKHEAKEEWDKAINAYVQVINSAEGAEGDQELPLYNRVGDLYVRLGKPADAVTFYERAADQYAEAGLFNNAIALCNKALRYVPNRLELLRKLGQFSAAQGFITDARRWYLEYAERQIKAGHLDDAFKALEDFADVHEDVEIREMLGHQLKAHAREDKAVIALQRAYSLRMQAGERQVAERLKNEILALNPNATLSAEAPAPTGRAAATGRAPEPVGWEQPGAAFVDLPTLGGLGLESAAGAAFGGNVSAELPRISEPQPAAWARMQA
jgi:tetratricopeptide (TPR) repeat protein